MNPQQPQYDPLRIFLSAEQFKSAASCLSDLLRRNRWDELFVPMQVNAALALELYLKTLLALNKRCTNSHHHGLMFQQLDKEYRDALSGQFDELAKDDPELLFMAGLDPRYKSDLGSILEDSGHVFERLRYLWEKPLPDKMRACFTLPIKFFRAEIMRLQPSFDSASSGLMNSSQMPASLKPNTALQVRVSPFGMKSNTIPPPSSDKQAGSGEPT